MRTCDPFRNPILALTCYHFGGGGGAPKAPKVPKQQPINIPEPTPISIPEPPAPAPPPPPPPPAATESKLEVQEKMDQQRKDAKRRKGMAASLIAGETGGANNSATGSGSLLG